MKNIELTSHLMLKDWMFYIQEQNKDALLLLPLSTFY